MYKYYDVNNSKILSQLRLISADSSEDNCRQQWGPVPLIIVVGVHVAVLWDRA